MNILMLTNTYLPHVGGVARSVDAFARRLRALGHEVLVVAPMFEGALAREPGVVRVPAIQRFNGSDFSVRLPVPGLLSRVLDSFAPDIVHSHHPFLLGDTALRVATRFDLPLVFTHHTLYERYTHYVPGDSPTLRRFVIALVREYANLCDAVIAPSETIARMLVDRGVTAPVSVIPTGVEPERFQDGDRRGLRRRLGIPDTAFVVGHVGRLAREKNLPFLARAVADFLARRADAHFLVVGDGPARAEIEQTLRAAGLGGRLHLTGTLQGRALADAYAAMDLFAFASQSETQGMVITEAMAAGIPVLAVDAPGVREVVQDGCNGRLLMQESEAQFTAALAALAALPAQARAELAEGARRTARALSLERCTDRLVALYHGLASVHPRGRVDERPWAQIRRRLETEWEIWSGRTEAAVRSLREEPGP